MTAPLQTTVFEITIQHRATDKASPLDDGIFEIKTVERDGKDVTGFVSCADGSVLTGALEKIDLKVCNHQKQTNH